MIPYVRTTRRIKNNVISFNTELPPTVRDNVKITGNRKNFWHETLFALISTYSIQVERWNFCKPA